MENFEALQGNIIQSLKSVLDSFGVCVSSVVERCSKWAYELPSQSKVRWVFFSALILRLLAVGFADVFLFAPSFDRQASWEFARIARLVLAGEGYSYRMVDGRLLPSAWMPPGYVGLLVVVFAVLGDGIAGFVFVQCLQAVMGAILSVVVYKIADSFIGRGAFLSGLITAIYPMLVYMSTEVHAVSMSVLLEVLVVWLLLRVQRHLSLKSLVAAGFLQGLQILFRGGATLGYVLLFPAWLIWRLPRRVRLRYAFLFFATSLIVLAPWSIRNYYVFDHFVPVQNLTGYALWRGHNEIATGTGRSFDGTGIGWSQSVSERLEDVPVTSEYEVVLDRLFLEEALDFIRANPERSLALAFRKFLFFWGFDPTHPGSSHPVYVGIWFLTLPFFLVGLFWSIRSCWKRFSLFYLLFIVETAKAMGFIVLPRYRLLLDPFILILSAQGILVAKNRFLHSISEFPPAREEDT